MATIKDVAQAAQVSAAAVSRVLNKDDNISVTPEVRARIFQAAHALGYVSPRQRKAAEHKTHLVIGVADWRIIRPDRPNVRLSSLSCLVQMMTDQYEVSFVRLTFGEPQKVDGIIALGVFSEKEIDFLLKKLEKRHSSTIKIMGKQTMGALLDQNAMRPGDYKHFSFVFFLTGPDQERDTVLPAGEYASLFYRGSYERLEEHCGTLFHGVAELGLTLDGAPLELYHIDAHDTDLEEEYLTELQVKVKRA